MAARQNKRALDAQPSHPLIGMADKLELFCHIFAVHSRKSHNTPHPLPLTDSIASFSTGELFIPLPRKKKEDERSALRNKQCAASGPFQNSVTHTRYQYGVTNLPLQIKTAAKALANSPGRGPSVLPAHARDEAREAAEVAIQVRVCACVRVYYAKWQRRHNWRGGNIAPVNVGNALLALRRAI